jgi:hypothetical protein
MAAVHNPFGTQPQVGDRVISEERREEQVMYLEKQEFWDAGARNPDIIQHSHDFRRREDIWKLEERFLVN